MDVSCHIVTVNNLQFNSLSDPFTKMCMYTFTYLDIEIWPIILYFPNECLNEAMRAINENVWMNPGLLLNVLSSSHVALTEETNTDDLQCVQIMKMIMCLCVSILLCEDKWIHLKLN